MSMPMDDDASWTCAVRVFMLDDGGKSGGIGLPQNIVAYLQECGAHFYCVVVDRSGSRSNYQSSSSLSSSSSSSSLRKSNSLTMPGLAAISAILPPPAAAFAAHCKIAVLLRQCKNYCVLNEYASENCAHRKLTRARTQKGRLLDT